MLSLEEVQPKNTGNKNVSILSFFFVPDAEMMKMKRVLESLTSANDDKVQGHVTSHI